MSLRATLAPALQVQVSEAISIQAPTIVLISFEIATWPHCGSSQ